VYAEEESMPSKQPTLTVRELIGDVAPKLTELTENVLFGDIWERPAEWFESIVRSRVSFRGGLLWSRNRGA
jgi:hypothetical protein